MERFRYEGDEPEHEKGDVEEMACYINRQRSQAVDNISEIFGATHLDEKTFVIPAVTTFFPEISSKVQAEDASFALAGAVKLASLIGANVVEFVMGRRVDRCLRTPIDKSAFKCDYVHSFKNEECLITAVEAIKKHAYPLAKSESSRLAAEIEPGFSYVLNDGEAVDIYIDSQKLRRFAFRFIKLLTQHGKGPSLSHFLSPHALMF